MLIFRLIELAFLFVFFYFTATQILIPSIKGTKVFPMFDGKRKQILSERQNLKSEISLEEMKIENEDLKHELDDLKGQSPESSTQKEG